MSTEKKAKKQPTVKKKTAPRMTKDKKMIVELKTQFEKSEEKYIRLKAEFDNFRKRKSKELLNLLEYDGESVIKGFLPVLDDLGRLIDAISSSGENQPDNQSLESGMKMIQSKIDKHFNQLNVVAFGKAGEKLDAELHDAMMVRSDPTKDDGIILEVYANGYYYKDKVIRHAKVVVNKI